MDDWADDEIERRHKAELDKELSKLVAEHGEDILERRKACELRRQQIKEREVRRPPPLRHLHPPQRAAAMA